jgi:DNA-binding SARP family transcriptional activator
MAGGMTSFRILGSIEAGVGEERLPIAGRRQLAVLAFLLLHANRPVSGDALSDAVWGRADRGGLKRLPMAIMRLRKALAPLAKGGDSVLRSGPAGYVLSVAPGELDAEVFQTRLKAGRRALEEDQAARAAEMLRDALALWRGPALAEVAFEDFAQAEIRRLEELRLVALEARIDADLHQGRHAELIGELEALVAEHCTRERLAGQLMVALYRSDRQAEALEVYQRVRAELAEQLGLEPGPAPKNCNGRS